MGEKFKTIDGYPKYSVSTTGRVVNSRNKEKELQIDKHGYYKTNLYRNGNGSSKRINRLVATAFIPNSDNKPDVNHIDGNKLNNSVDNLEWVTKSENMIHAYKTGLAKPHPSYGMRGHKNPNAGRKGLKVQIIETGEKFDSIKDCANAIGGSDRAICECLKGRQDSHRGYHFEYL